MENKVQIGNATYEVLDRKTSQDFENEGLANFAAHIRKYRISAVLTVKKPRGSRTFMAYERPSLGGGYYQWLVGVGCGHERNS